MDDRTPFEIADGLVDEALARYRETKKRFNLQDPEFYKCPKCGKTMIGKLDGPECPDCWQKKRDDQIKAWKDAEHKRNENKKAAGGLVDKVKKAQQQREEPQRYGAERAYPED